MAGAPPERNLPQHIDRRRSVLRLYPLVGLLLPRDRTVVLVDLRALEKKHKFSLTKADVAHLADGPNLQPTSVHRNALAREPHHGPCVQVFP